MSARAALQPIASGGVPNAADLFRLGMRRLAGACTIITSRGDEGLGRSGWVGMVATAVASVTAEPPRLLVCVNRSTFAHGVITRSGVLGVNVLGSDGLDQARCFSGGVPPQERFAGGNWQIAPAGAPLLASALVGFDCRVAEAIAASTHDIFICDVADVLLREQGGDPLIYFDGAFLGERPCN